VFWLAHEPIASISALGKAPTADPASFGNDHKSLLPDHAPRSTAKSIGNTPPSEGALPSIATGPATALHLTDTDTARSVRQPLGRTPTPQQKIDLSSLTMDLDFQQTIDRQAPLLPTVKQTTPIAPTTANKKVHSSTSDGNHFAPTEPDWIHTTIKPGDTLTRIFKRLEINPAVAISLSRLPNGELLNQLRPGPHLDILATANKLTALRYRHDRLKIVEVKQDAGQYIVKPIERKFDIVEREIHGTINSSLYSDGTAAGLDEAVLYRLARIFRWQIDFTRDIRPNDQFAVIYDEQHLDGRKVSNGPIRAAAFSVNGKTFRAVRHVDSNGTSHYYTPQGESVQSMFLRSPLRFSRVTSHFSNNRYHPVLKKWRAHKGVDYGAPQGEGVMATANGTVILAGRKGAYGRVVMLQHGKRYQTLYAHLSRIAKGLRNGTSVKQGQTIGYVGRSGLATGPHLHYEFRVNGAHRNPLTVKLPRSRPVPDGEKNAFVKTAKLWTTRLERLAPR
jgi:murein DD-endopeptidase MepM/ murein hydrolase activator NlpD